MTRSAVARIVAGGDCRQVQEASFWGQIEGTV